MLMLIFHHNKFMIINDIALNEFGSCMSVRRQSERHSVTIIAQKCTKRTITVNGQ